MKKQTGFTLIELVIVVIILGLLGAAAIPRFINATDDARDASVEGVAGGFASAVGIVRAEWELNGRQPASVVLDLDDDSVGDVYVGDRGYPTAASAATAYTAMTATTCKGVFDAVLTSPPSSVAGGDNFTDERYVVTLQAGATATDADQCVYTLIETSATAAAIATGDAMSATVNATTQSEGQGFVYSASSGQVSVFKN
jgi:MSHA pilin protein MshB